MSYHFSVEHRIQDRLQPVYKMDSTFFNVKRRYLFLEVPSDNFKSLVVCELLFFIYPYFGMPRRGHS